MGKKQWRKEADVILNSILDYLKLNERVVHIGQEPYKSDFFTIFRDAFKNGFCGTTKRTFIDGDMIWAYAKDAGWVHAEMVPGETRYDDIQMVQTWWNEWTYACLRKPLPRRYVRKSPS